MSAILIPFKQDVKSNPEPRAQGKIDRPANAPQPFTARDELDAGALITARVESIDHLLEWIKFATLATVSDWRQVWEIGHLNAQHLHSKISDLPFRPDYAAKINEIIQNSRAMLDEDNKFWDACEKIYDEEMREVEQMARAARVRVCTRIVQELGEDTGTHELCESILTNDLQRYTRDFDWN